MDFTRFGKMTLLLKFPFCNEVTRTFPSFTDMTLACTKHPGKAKSSAIVSLDCGRRDRPESGEAGGALGRGIGGKGQGGHLRSVHTRSWGQGCPSDGTWR
jgi:hypothetical protein